MRRLVPVPESARSAHAVFTAEPIGAETGLVPPPPSLLRHFGASDDDLAHLEARPHLHVMLAESPLTEAAERLVESRRAALALAGEHDGVVVDLAIPRIVTHTADAADLTVAAQWVAVDTVLNGDADPGAVTRGLDAFGLPELSVPEVPRDWLAAVIAVLTGLAHRLIVEWPANDPVGPATITLRDVARAFGDAAAEDTPTDRAIDVLIAYTGGDLVVTLVDDPTGLFAP